MIRVITRHVDKYSIIFEYNTFKIFILEYEKFRLVLNSLTYSEVLFVSIEQLDLLISFSLRFEDVNWNCFSSPFTVCLQLTEKCNLKCKYCFAIGEKKSNIFDFKSIDRINENKEMFSVLITGGEVLLSENFIDVIDKIDAYNRIITIDTNGVLLHDLLKNNISLCQKIIDNYMVIRISLDCHLKEINNLTRGSYDSVLKSIKFALVKNIIIKINTVIHKENIITLDSFAEFLIEIGVKYWTLFRLNKSTSFYNELSLNSNYEEEIINALMKKYKSKLTINYVINKPGYSHFMIDVHGKYLLINSAEDSIVEIGNVEQNSIKDLKTYNTFINHYERYLCNSKIDQHSELIESI